MAMHKMSESLVIHALGIKNEAATEYQTRKKVLRHRLLLTKLSDQIGLSSTEQ
jgi:hypothetical protein